MSAKTFPVRRIGGSGLTAPAIGLGCMSLSGVYNKISDDQGEALIKAALDNGVTLLDSSDSYGSGHNEELVGRAIRGRRDQVVLASKFGNLGGKGGKFADGRPEFVIASCEASLRRLGVETIDLYYQHRVDPQVPIEDTVGAMAELVEQGKVRHLGVSNFTPSQFDMLSSWLPFPLVTNQVELHPLRPEPFLDGTLDQCLRQRISPMAWSPLAGGRLLTGEGPAELRVREVLWGLSQKH